MNETLIYTIVIITAIGAVSAIILFYISQKFKVFEDPRIDEVEGMLPSANCGGCGYAGCRAFAEACVNADDLKEMNCPVGGAEMMNNIGPYLGLEVVNSHPTTAVLRCNGKCEYRPKKNHFDGVKSCAIASANYGGESGCSFGCLGFGDCVDVCKFDALSMDPVTGLPVVDDARCVACGACVEACPKMLFELRKQMPKYRKIYVACMNREKGGVAARSCSVACIGCGKCVTACTFDAITLNNHLAFIDSDKCKLCRKCVSVCPTGSILEINFPPRKIKEEAEAVQA